MLFQTSAYVMFAAVSLAEVNDVATFRVSRRGARVQGYEETPM